MRIDTITKSIASVVPYSLTPSLPPHTTLTMAAPQADGYYPRLNAAMVQSGSYNSQIVSLMGRFTSGAGADNTVGFSCCDGGTLTLSVEHADFPNMDVADGPVVEVVGQVMEDSVVAVRITRVLCADCWCLYHRYSVIVRALAHSLTLSHLSP